MKNLLNVLFLLVGLGVGVGTGLILAPSDTMEESANPEKTETKKSKPAKSTGEKAGNTDVSSDFEYLKLTKQFVVPVVDSERIAALVTMSLSLEITPGMAEAFYAVEPKLRDGFLQVMFDHANTGGFDGAFTESDNMKVLRKALLETARKDLGDDVSQVLIMSVSRQDV